MPRSRKAAAVRQLAPCHGSLREHIGGRAEQPACPSWGLTTLGPSPCQRQQHQRDVFGSGLTGELRGTWRAAAARVRLCRMCMRVLTSRLMHVM
jgi:hypothetical protein